MVSYNIKVCPNTDSNRFSTEFCVHSEDVFAIYDRNVTTSEARVNVWKTELNRILPGAQLYSANCPAQFPQGKNNVEKYLKTL